MEIDWIHRLTAPDGTDGTLNLCFNALDRHVVHGRADEPAIANDRQTSYARLLEDVAAFGGSAAGVRRRTRRHGRRAAAAGP